MAAVSLFLHSTGTTPQLWATVPDEVAAGVGRLAPANLGYPPNPPLRRGQPGGAAADAAHLLASLGDEGEVHLYGHSYGGVVALHLLRSLGARVRSVFLYEPVLFGALARHAGSDALAIADANAFRDHPWFLGDEERGGTDAWLEVFIDYWNRPGSWAALPDPARAFLRSVGWKMFQEVRSCFHDFETFEHPGLRGIPVTLAMGSRSPRASRAMVQALALENPGARLVELQGTGHMAPLTHARLLNEALREHAARVRAAPR